MRHKEKIYDYFLSNHLTSDFFLLRQSFIPFIKKNFTAIDFIIITMEKFYRKSYTNNNKEFIWNAK